MRARASLGILLALAVASACASPPEPAPIQVAPAPGPEDQLAAFRATLPETLVGVVTPLAGGALPPGSVVRVDLLDVSHPETPPSLVAQRWIEPTGPLPLAFELPLPRDELVPEGRYGLAARIYAGERLLYVSDATLPVPLDVRRSGPLELVVRPTR